jgi:O-methyltransferase
MKQLLRRVVRASGFDIVRYRGAPPAKALPADVPEPDREILARIGPYTMTSIERQLALIHAVRYVARHGIEGSIVECGVWRGGSSMAAALTLLQEGQADRDLFLYDTFEGMTAPTDVDRTADGTPARAHLEADRRKERYWCIAGLEDVRQNMASTGYPAERLHFVQGPVERTLPACLPGGPLAVLRLDTDWYESTRHELVHLFPRLSRRGVLLIDDYGHWQGARKAVDEYLSELADPYFLHRIDYTGRLLIKA